MFASLSGKIEGMSESDMSRTFGRVDDDGTVYVIEADGERRVGQVPDVDKSEALNFYIRRFESLETEVELLTQRIQSATIEPGRARKQISELKSNIATANAVGDLAGLVAKVDALTPLVDHIEVQRKQQRAEEMANVQARKAEMVAQAESVAKGNDWRGGGDKFRSLLDEWKKLPRTEKAVDDDLWHQFSTARSTFSKRRKAHFAQLDERRAEAQRKKEKIIERARQIADSTDWGPTAGEFRDLMAQWKAAGAAPRKIDDKLWAEFRGLQDTFFDARNATFAAEEEEFQANAEAKRQLLDKAEAEILPVEDATEAREKFRRFLDEYNEYGKVPRADMKPLDNRLRDLERAISAVEQEEWRKSDPEVRDRAAATVTMFSSQIEKLEADLAKAQEAGNAKKVRALTESIEAYRALMGQAQKALDEFTS